MNINSIYSGTSIYGLYSTMFQGNMSLHSVKLNKNLFPTNKAPGNQQIDEDAMKYVNNIKSASKGIGSSLKDLSGPAFKKKTAESTDDDVKKYAKSAVEGFVKNYNDLYTESVQKTSDAKAQNLASKMIGISKTYMGSLARIGIGFDRDGKMTIDSDKLDAAAENGSLEKFFTENNGKNYGFTNQLSRLADNVSRNTSNYVSRTQFGSNLTENFAYSSFGNLVQYNYLSSGWMLDYSY